VASTYENRGVSEQRSPGALPELLDAKGLQAELGVTRAAAEAIMRQLPVIQIPGLRKVYVCRPDVERLLEECMSAKDEVP
jgi:hypothetical protein